MSPPGRRTDLAVIAAIFTLAAIIAAVLYVMP